MRAKMKTRALITGIAMLLLATAASYAKNPADTAVSECQTMLGDHLAKFWIEPDMKTEELIITNDKGESVRYGQNNVPDPMLMLLYTMVHNNQCRQLRPWPTQ